MTTTTTNKKEQRKTYRVFYPKPSRAKEILHKRWKEKMKKFYDADVKMVMNHSRK